MAAHAPAMRHYPEMHVPRQLMLALGLCLLPLPLAAQHGAHGAHAEAAPEGRMPLFENLGVYTRPITTSAPLAQQYFDQGMRLAFGFAHTEAVRSFREAAALDAQCAMCWWGAAWASGPHINNPRRDSVTLAAGYEAAQEARRLRRHASPVEQALIDALLTRYARVPSEANRPGLDSAWARAVADVVRRFPADLDAATFYGEALMVLRAWDYWTPEGTPQPGTPELLAALESVLARDIRHPGACHLYIHAVEASPDPGRAVPCAVLLEDAIPGVSHIPHMPAHVLVHVGRWGDAVRGNQKARMADLEAADGRAVAVYTMHNLHMLVFAASFDGQSAVALQAARDMARAAPGNVRFLVELKARFGRWRDLLAMTDPPAAALSLTSWRYARGLAFLRTGEPDSARAYLDALREQLDTTSATAGTRRNLTGIAHGILAGELAAATGDYAEAERLVREAVGFDDDLGYNEPEPWLLPPRQVLGAILLEAGRAADAEQAFRENLRQHPENGWALKGLEQSLRAQDRGPEAEEVRRRLERAWHRADVRLMGARF
jgi:tetratricopeptide (TPR) repeat protein